MIICDHLEVNKQDIFITLIFNLYKFFKVKSVTIWDFRRAEMNKVLAFVLCFAAFADAGPNCTDPGELRNINEIAPFD